MDVTIYTATGCARCKIVKSFMNEQNITFLEKDMKAEGKEDFQAFYKANRHGIFRGPDGIEFPIITDGKEIRQGIGAAIAYLHSGRKLEGFFSVGTLHKEWVDGIHISGGRLEHADRFIEVLSYLKGNNLKLQIDTTGQHSEILQKVFAKGLADVVIVNLPGSPKLYSQILGTDVEREDIKKTIATAIQFPEYKIQTTVVPVKGDNGEYRYLTPDEIGETAKLISEATGSNKIPYLIKRFNPPGNKAEEAGLPASLTATQLLSYRARARAFQVFTEIEK
ncbi:MAG: glutaredoxin family protein [Peptococcaceae bacterium]